MKYEIKTTLNTGKELIEPGEVLDIPEEDAAPLLAINAITPVGDEVEADVEDEDGVGGEGEPDKKPPAKKAATKKTTSKK